MRSGRLAAAAAAFTAVAAVSLMTPEVSQAAASPSAVTYWQFRNSTAVHSNDCLGSGKPAGQASVFLSVDCRSPYEKWDWINTYQLQNEGSGYCLDSDDIHGTGANAVYAAPCNSYRYAQNWQFVATEVGGSLTGRLWNEDGETLYMVGDTVRASFDRQPSDDNWIGWH